MNNGGDSQKVIHHQSQYSNDSNMSMLGRISSSFYHLKQGLKEGIKLALDYEEISAQVYAKAIKELFQETYFMEQWIAQLLSQESRSNEEQILLQKLSKISSFLHENILSIILADILSLCETYFLQETNKMMEQVPFKGLEDR